ncbi:MAG: hypothetical protein ACPLZD_00810 [Candidatus Saccharicenans sp.]|nr:MAG: hypothetical protein C0168_07870 [Candidatus Aminicenantes bacterium]HEK85148.1 hypothetical protein [Candidatus Aminicenantes bacterium]
MNITSLKSKFLKFLPNAIFLIFGFWLLLPFIKIERSDFSQAKILVYRLALGIMVLIIMLGKMGFDVFFPQGVAEKVSNTKSILFIIFGVLILAFVVYIIIQAGSLFMSTYPQSTSINQ